MKIRISCLPAISGLSAVIVACTPAAQKQISPVQSPPGAWPERAVRRDIPIQPQIKRAYAKGTRDSTGAPGPRYFQQSVDYKIDASIDPSTNRLTGSETITLHNTTPDTLRTIVVRLYQNYFTPTVARTDYVTDITDGITIERLSLNGSSISITDTARYERDERIAVIKPPSPIMPGADVTLEAAWHFTVPNVDTTERGERMGRFGNYLYQIAQWYPQIAMYDEMRGWDTDQYLGLSEFYNQFGKFDVRITAPGGWLLGATGELQNPSEVYSQRTRDRLSLAMKSDSTVHVVSANERGASSTAPGATLTWHFVAPRVNDFAFSVSRDYVLEATRANIPGKGYIPISVYYLPQHTRYQTNRITQVAARALEEHSRYLFPYEFSQGTILDGPETGMEYPMVIFSGSNVGTTIHEFGHQWFPMQVGSNETRYGWMDEGLNDFIDVNAQANISKQPADYQNGSRGYLRIAGSELEAPMMFPSEGAGYGISAYSKAPIALYALGGIVGDSAVHSALRNYAVQWKFKHPSPWDFFMSMNRSLGKDLGWFWNQWWFTTNTFDQSVESVTTEGDNAKINVDDRGEMVAPVIAKVTFTDSSTETIRTPAEAWFAGARRVSVTVQLRGRSIKQVELDPENRFQDVDKKNNVWPARLSPAK